MMAKKPFPFAKKGKTPSAGVKEEKAVANLPPWLKKKGTKIPKKKGGK
jgi:hypothetical protein